ncbi:MAG: hypothetical protein MUC48_27310 [Leptolyngbya sp. Prado105]|nr:hypothetical protein [Leptolyngbya sp. Prado105]
MFSIEFCSIYLGIQLYGVKKRTLQQNATSATLFVKFDALVTVEKLTESVIAEIPLSKSEA